MRHASTATVAAIVAVALYFALAWGTEGIVALTSPNYGLEDVWRSQVIFSVGRLLNLDPVGLLKLAAFVAAVKVAVAGICTLHILDRFRSFAAGQARSELLEGALIVVVALSIVSAGPAVWSNSTALLREHAMQLAFAALATGLCIVERRLAQADGEDAQAVAEEAPAAGEWYSPLR